MKYLDQRAEVILRDLEKLMILDFETIRYWEIVEGFYINKEELLEKKPLFIKYDTKKDFFTYKDKYYWFKTKVKIPDRFVGKKLWININTGASGGGCQNPQFLMFIDNVLIQGLDTKHEESLIFEKAPNKEIEIDLQAHTGYFHTDLKLSSKFFLLDEKIQKLFYDIKVIILSFEWLNKDSHERIYLGYHINEAINLLDMRNPYSESFYNSIDEAISYLDKYIYTDYAGYSDVIASCIGHTHIDVAWRWTIEQSRQKVARSFSTVVKLMEEYDNYKFMSSQPVLYKYLKERYPETYEKVKKLIKDKRWEAEGSLYLEADTNLTSGESLLRQAYWGKKFFKDEFGVEKNDILWLPDVFGYSGNLPQIMKKCDIKYFMTTKLNWNQYNKMPNDTFIWQGIDGSEILTHLITTTELKQNKENYFTTYNGMLHPDAIMGAWNRYQNKNINNDVLISYGYGDGGGGPTREMLEISRRMEKGIKGIPQVRQRFAIDYFNDLEKRVMCNKRLEKWIGELYFEYHRGTLTSMGRNKRSNRKAEIALMDLEFIALLSKLDYPQEKLDRIWEVVLVNQFHDILPGSSIKEVYDVTKIEYEEIENELKEIKEKYLKSYISKEEGITLWNSLSHIRSDYVDLRDILGNKSGKLGDNIVQNGIGYIKDLPSKGYRSYDFKEENINGEIYFKDKVVKTDRYTLIFDDKYQIKSIYDEKERREIVIQGKLANELIMYEDKPMWHDNWDIDEYYSEKSYKVDNLKSVKVIENGPIYMILRIEREISRSSIIQDIYFYKHIDRIDFKTIINWDDSQHLLKAHFPLNLHTNEASYDIQFGHIKRPTHKNTSWDRARFEVGGHKWVDLSENNYGVAILNDCKYGQSVNFTDIGITLLKSGNEPYDKTDRETHYITYSLLLHSGNLTNSNVIKQGYELNYPILAVKGKTDKFEYSFVSVDKENIVIETIKKSFDNKGYILRIYEAYNQFTRFKLNFADIPKKAYLTNALEEIIKEIDITKEIEIKPLEFITIKIER